MNYRHLTHYFGLYPTHPESTICRGKGLVITRKQVINKTKTDVTFEKRLIRTGCLKLFDLHGAVIFNDTDALMTSASRSQSSPCNVWELIEPCDIFKLHPVNVEKEVSDVYTSNSLYKIPGWNVPALTRIVPAWPDEVPMGMVTSLFAFRFVNLKVVSSILRI